ncbi:hypothetical protein CC2G_001411 [Coprinopsis cinerea AmutBmut pab1-1]|nr:hypothetical protein CC2G_001411 [Coprinopsis cinerea AmutBmut pab1-1]
MFGSNVPSPSSSPQDNFILQPPSPYARRIPIYSHPSQATRQPMFEVWKDKDHVSWAWDEQTLAQNQPDHPKRKSVGKDSVGGGGTEWAAWYQFTAPTEKLSSAYIPFLADMFVNTTHLIPEEEGGEPEAAAWSPTLTLAIDFKFPIRLLTPEWHARRTAGLYSAGRFINYPQGRHDIYVEVWSAPSEIGEGAPPKEGWREKQVCLAVATQMALTLPVAVNLRNGKRKGQGGESKL